MKKERGAPPRFKGPQRTKRLKALAQRRRLYRYSLVGLGASP
jgi:hypothetical protein